MITWKALHICDQVQFLVKDFDGESIESASITEVDDDHIIASGNGMSFWIDDDTADQFMIVAA